MKERISITLDREIVELLDSLAKKRKFRNRSHIVECAVERLAEDEIGIPGEKAERGKGGAGKNA